LQTGKPLQNSKLEALTGKGKRNIWGKTIYKWRFVFQQKMFEYPQGRYKILAPGLAQN
jgi:hypothetical protein